MDYARAATPRPTNRTVDSLIAAAPINDRASEGVSSDDLPMPLFLQTGQTDSFSRNFYLCNRRVVRFLTKLSRAPAYGWVFECVGVPPYPTTSGSQFYIHKSGPSTRKNPVPSC